MLEMMIAMVMLLALSFILMPADMPSPKAACQRACSKRWANSPAPRVIERRLRGQPPAKSRQVVRRKCGMSSLAWTCDRKKRLVHSIGVDYPNRLKFDRDSCIHATV